MELLFSVTLVLPLLKKNHRILLYACCLYYEGEQEKPFHNCASGNQKHGCITDVYTNRHWWVVYEPYMNVIYTQNHSRTHGYSTKRILLSVRILNVFIMKNFRKKQAHVHVQEVKFSCGEGC